MSASAEGPFNLDSPLHLAQLNRLLEFSHTPQVSIYLKTPGEEPQRTTLRWPLPQSPPDALSSPNSSISQERPGFQTHSDLRDPPIPQTSPLPPVEAIYAVGSYTKILLNVAYARLLCHKDYEHLGLSWETPACDIFNEIREKKGKSTIKRLWGNPQIRQLLVHQNGIASMNRLLFAPDGTFIMSEDEFIAVAPLITEDFYKDKYPHRGWVDYSNGNHIFAGMILEEVTGRELHDLMCELVFEPLNMTHSFMNEESLAAHAVQADVAIGHRGTSNRSQETAPPSRYLADVVEVAALGAHSSAEDIAKLLHAILDAVDGESESFFDETEVDYFLHSFCHSPGGASTLGGLFASLDSPLARDESLNKILMHPANFSPYVLGRRDDGSKCKVHYKAGAVDGFTCSTYLLLNDRIFVLVFANSSGPVDITGYIASYIMQETVPLFPRIDVIGKAIEEGQVCLRRLQEIEHKDLGSTTCSDDVGDLVGTYQHVRYLQQITITRDGATFIHGQQKTSSPMKLIRVAPQRVRISPGARGFTIDRWSVWDDLEFTVTVESKGRISLIGNNGQDRYLKLQS